MGGNGERDAFEEYGEWDLPYHKWRGGDGSPARELSRTERALRSVLEMVLGREDGLAWRLA